MAAAAVAVQVMVEAVTAMEEAAVATAMGAEVMTATAEAEGAKAMVVVAMEAGEVHSVVERVALGSTETRPRKTVGTERLVLAI